MTSTGASSSKKRAQYTTRACNWLGSVLKSFKGHECTWGGDGEFQRPPTKQLVESLRVNVKVLEDQVTKLKAGNEPASIPVSSEAPKNTTPSPLQFRLPRSPWPEYQSHPSPITGVFGATESSLNDTYQYIFNIDHIVPLAEQPEIAQRSLLCDWDRYLPPLGDVQLSRLEHDLALDRCFKYSRNWLMCLIPQFFLRDMLRSLAHDSNTTHPRPTHLPLASYYSPLLHCSILALATSSSDNLLLKQQTTRARLASHAKDLLNQELSCPSLSLVQALVLLSEYHCGLAEREQGYMYMGMAIRAIRACEPPPV
ncbi:hypothetical protein BDV93DRAFT_553688 [Ceratobasidium sp. AG-I]|nr:hypothetical protein BDV93DRAFT_553688 [Ceratobasidium sp. AG-I]